MDLAEKVKTAGGVAAILGLVWTIYVYRKARGRLRVTAWFGDENGSRKIGEIEKSSISVQAVNVDTRDVVLRAFNVEYRTGFGGLRLPVYVEIGLMPPETKDWVKIEPGLRHVLTVPDTMNMILTGVSVTTSLNRVYQISKMNLIRLRLEQYNILRHRRKAAAQGQTGSSADEDRD